MDSESPDLQQTPAKIKISSFNNPNLLKIIVIGFSVLVVCIVTGIGGYILGIKKEQQYIKPLQSTPTPTIPIHLSISTTQQLEKETWGTFSQEFIEGYQYQVKYPLNKNSYPVMINGKDSGWPISQLDQYFSTIIEFGDNTLGITDIDPTTCYKTTCLGIFETINSIQTASISGILSKKIQGTAYGGGGVRLLPEAPPIELYIVPFQNKYFVLYGNGGVEFDQFVSSFEIYDIHTGFSP